MTKVYCPYSDTEIDESLANSEHIVPLSLGGVNGYEILVDASQNATLGSELEGALTKELIFSLKRTEYDARGHNRKEPWAVVRRAKLGVDEAPGQARLHRHHGIQVWDARKREVVRGPVQVTLETTINLSLPIRLTAKIALAAGYYAYGDLFRRQVDHRQIRDAMNIDPYSLDSTKDPDELGLGHMDLLVDTYLMPAPTDPGDPLSILRAFCNSFRGSVVLVFLGPKNLGFSVGILGQYLGMLNVSADTSNFPKKGDYEWGHVMAMAGGKLLRCSWYHGLSQFAGMSG